MREQDKYLPIANISRIMKEALPHNAKVSKDAKELVQNCVSDYIIYITSQCGLCELCMTQASCTDTHVTHCKAEMSSMPHQCRPRKWTVSVMLFERV